MFSKLFKSFRLIIKTNSRSYSSKNRSLSSLIRFQMDTKAVYGPQHITKQERPTKPSELDIVSTDPKKNLFDKDTELLYGTSNGFYRACSVPKGISIKERQRYLRHLFRIPRGYPISLYPQAYVPNKYLGLRKKKDK